MGIMVNLWTPPSLCAKCILCSNTSRWRKNINSLLWGLLYDYGNQNNIYWERDTYIADLHYCHYNGKGRSISSSVILLRKCFTYLSTPLPDARQEMDWALIPHLSSDLMNAQRCLVPISCKNRENPSKLHHITYITILFLQDRQLVNLPVCILEVCKLALVTQNMDSWLNTKAVNQWQAFASCSWNAPVVHS